MHEIVEKGLEDHLTGVGSREFHLHLSQCPACHAEVEGIQQVSSLLVSLRVESEFAPPLGFSSRLMTSIAQRERRSIWNAFTLDPGFIRKLAVASLLGLVAFGGYLATQPNDGIARGHTPEAVMASHDSSAAPDDLQHMDGMLMTLATYRQ